MNFSWMSVLSWAAQAATPAAAPPAGDAAGQTGAQPTYPIWMALGLIIVLYYVMMSRPQKAEARKRQEMLDTLAKGDSVVTSGGIMGTVESVDTTKHIVTLSVAPKVIMKFTKASIASVTSKKGKGGGDEAEPKA